MYKNDNLIRANAKYVPVYCKNDVFENGFIFSEFSTHFTRIIEDANQIKICYVKPLDQNLTAITDLGTDEMRVLYSPGFITGEQ